MNREFGAGTPAKTSRIVVAMSGGVDSSVAAALLLKQGFEVIGVTLQLQPCSQTEATRSCCGIDGPVRARAVAGQLGIPHYVLNCEQEFEVRVLKPAWQEYAVGRTPSPCLRCNELIKFGLLLEWAKEIGAEAVATGHYAKIVFSEDGSTALLRGADREKDQSYFLARLTVAQLRQILFPVGAMQKSEVRALAREFGLPNAEAPESQDACLVKAGESFAEMLRRRFGAEARPGTIVDGSGTMLGRHEGIHFFTVGQRRGLGVAASGRSWVTAIDPETATVVVTHDERDLVGRGMVAADVVWFGEPPVTWPISCEVQARYRQQPAAAELEAIATNAVKVTVSGRIRAVTPGQAAVFYRGNRVLGSGWILSKL